MTAIEDLAAQPAASVKDLVLPDTPSVPELRRPPSLVLIMRVTAHVTGVSAKLLRSPSRLRDIVRARQIVMHIAVREFGYSLPRVGRALGGRDHTTVLHGCRTIERLNDPAINAQLVEVLRVLADVMSGKEPPPPPPVQEIALPEAAETPEVFSLVEGRPTFGQQLAELFKLHNRGWSVGGLSRRYDLPRPVVAKLVGATWWAGPRNPEAVSA